MQCMRVFLRLLRHNVDSARVVVGVADLEPDTGRSSSNGITG
jgi:hypothetical protein